MAKDYGIWMVRAGSGGYLIEEFLKMEIVAIGWNDLGPISLDIKYEELKTLFKETYPDDTDGRVNQCVGQIWRFVMEFNVGDKIVTYDSSSRQYYLGEVTSEYKYSVNYEYYNYRKADWRTNSVNRDELTVKTKNTLGSTLTIFELPRAVWDELLVASGQLIEEIKPMSEDVVEENRDTDLEQIKSDIIAKSKEFTKDIIAKLSWQDTERLVAGILRCLGYKTRMTSRGSDLGSDIMASPDELGLEDPRIKVEVKKRTNDKVGAPEIRNFIGGLREHNKGIFITTTGFTKEAVYEAERANFAITLIDSDWLVDLLISNYENLDPEIKALVPLRRIYWPV